MQLPPALQDSHVRVQVRILSDEPQVAFIHREATVGKVIQETLNEFTNEKELDDNRNYVLSYQERPLNNDDLIGELILEDGAELILGYMQFITGGVTGGLTVKPEAIAEAAPTNQRITLNLVNGQKQFNIDVLPALIGRPDVNDTSLTNEPLAVNLEPFEEVGRRTVSRRHARLMREGGQIVVTSLNERNLVYVNGQPVPFGDKHRLRGGETLRIGSIEMTVSLN